MKHDEHGFYLSDRFLALCEVFVVPLVSHCKPSPLYLPPLRISWWYPCSSFTTKAVCKEISNHVTDVSGRTILRVFMGEEDILLFTALVFSTH